MLTKKPTKNKNTIDQNLHVMSLSFEHRHYAQMKAHHIFILLEPSYPSS
jgi:hypothetical protein